MHRIDTNMPNIDTNMPTRVVIYPIYILYYNLRDDGELFARHIIE